MNIKPKIKVALVKPPIIGHQYRGTGVYTESIYQALRQSKDVSVSLVDFNDNLGQFDVVHYPYFDPFFLTLPVFKNRMTVVTVHDLIPMKYPQYFPKGIRGSVKWQIQKFSLKLTGAIITDSNASKEDITRYTGIDAKKIHVIYLGVGKKFRLISSKEKLNELRKRLNLPQEYLLFVGDVNYNKNVDGIIKAYAIINKVHPSLKLVLVGNGFINKSRQLTKIKQLIDSLKITDNINIIEHVAIDDLAGIYNLAKVYLQPSFAEGFGLPVLEAMACGCPVVVSNRSSLPEIAGDSAVLVNPYNHEMIAETVGELAADISRLQKMRNKGLERVKMFTWEKTANQTINVYRKLIESRTD